jgi:hypothetical protein
VATNDEIASDIEAVLSDIERLVSSAPADRWNERAYENGWNARELLSHIASTSRPASFILSLAQAPASAPVPAMAAFDQDAFNAQQVALRSSRSVAEVLAEISANLQQDIAQVRAADDALLEKQFTAPWGIEGTVGDVIVASLKGHLRMHLGDLEAALAKG